MLLFEETLDLFYLVVAAHEDARPVVDILGNNLHHPVHLAVQSLTASCKIWLA